MDITLNLLSIVGIIILAVTLIATNVESWTVGDGIGYASLILTGGALLALGQLVYT